MKTNFYKSPSSKRSASISWRLRIPFNFLLFTILFTSFLSFDVNAQIFPENYSKLDRGSRTTIIWSHFGKSSSSNFPAMYEVKIEKFAKKSEVFIIKNYKENNDKYPSNKIDFNVPCDPDAYYSVTVSAYKEVKHYGRKSTYELITKLDKTHYSLKQKPHFNLPSQSKINIGSHDFNVKIPNPYRYDGLLFFSDPNQDPIADIKWDGKDSFIYEGNHPISTVVFYKGYFNSRCSKQFPEEGYFTTLTLINIPKFPEVVFPTEFVKRPDNYWVKDEPETYAYLNTLVTAARDSFLKIIETANKNPYLHIGKPLFEPLWTSNTPNASTFYRPQTIGSMPSGSYVAYYDLPNRGGSCGSFSMDLKLNLYFTTYAPGRRDGDPGDYKPVFQGSNQYLDIIAEDLYTQEVCREIEAPIPLIKIVNSGENKCVSVNLNYPFYKDAVWSKEINGVETEILRGLKYCSTFTYDSKNLAGSTIYVRYLGDNGYLGPKTAFLIIPLPPFDYEKLQEVTINVPPPIGQREEVTECDILGSYFDLKDYGIENYTNTLANFKDSFNQLDLLVKLKEFTVKTYWTDYKEFTRYIPPGNDGEYVSRVCFDNLPAGDTTSNIYYVKLDVNNNVELIDPATNDTNTINVYTYPDVSIAEQKVKKSEPLPVDIHSCNPIPRINPFYNSINCNTIKYRPLCENDSFKLGPPLPENGTSTYSYKWNTAEGINDSLIRNPVGTWEDLPYMEHYTFYKVQIEENTNTGLPVINTIECDVLYKCRNCGVNYKTEDVSEPITIVAEDFTLYPNPSNGIINISFQSEDLTSGTFEIYNYLGQLIFDTNINNSSLSIDLTNYPKAGYLAKFTTTEGKVVIKRFATF